LEEQGDERRLARADHIRVQLALARIADDDPARQGLLVREKLLWDAHGEEWRAEVELPLRELTFERGFAATAYISIGDFLAHRETIFARLPIRNLVFHSDWAYVWELAQCPALGRLLAIELGGDTSLDQEGVAALLASPHLGRLRELAFGSQGYRPWLGEVLG